MRIGVVVLSGLLIGGFTVQGLYRVLSSVTEPTTLLGGSLGFLVCTTVVAIAGTVLWARKHKWLGGSIAAGAIVWAGLVTWIVYEFSTGMSRFP